MKRDELVKRAETAVDALETVTVGDPWAEENTEAAELYIELYDGAQGELFPPQIEPASADVLAHFAFLEPKTQAGYGEALAQLHGASVTSHPELASLLRSPTIVARVCAAGASQATVLQRPAAELANEARRQFQLDVAHQLADHPELGPAAAAFVAAEMLLHRIELAVEPHEAHAAAAAEEIEADELERRSVRRGELAKQFHRLGPNHKFCVEGIRDGARMQADQVAGVLVGGMWDGHLDALEEYLAALPAGLQARAGVPA